MRQWILKACPECNYAVAMVNAPVHQQGCSHPSCVEVGVAEIVRPLAIKCEYKGEELILDPDRVTFVYATDGV